MPSTRQILVQSHTGASFFVDASSSLANLKSTLGGSGHSCDDFVLHASGHGLIHDADESASLASIMSLSAGSVDSSTLPRITATRRVRGGKLVKVKMMTDHLPCGSEVTIDIDGQSSKDEIKMKLSEATGVPFEHVKVMLSGINQIVTGDKRTNIGFSSCGYANSVELAVEKAE